MIDLLKKRYMVINRSPASIDPIGTIREEGSFTFDMRDYPNLYRLMDWWEHRAPEDMPIFVRKESEKDGYHLKGDCLQVEWLWNPENLVASAGKSLWVAKVNKMHYYNADVLSPISKGEYDKVPKEQKSSN